jgi:hypothetical protein
MLKIVKLREDVNANALRNTETGYRPEADYFMRNLEGRDLTVVNETQNQATVEDHKGEQWTAMRSDLVNRGPFATVGQELTKGERGQRHG